MSDRKPHIAIIIGSTRPTRFADKPAQYLLEKAQARDDLTAEIVDLRDFDLPFFAEPASDMWMPSEDPKARAWQAEIDRFDGFVFLVAEYNHSITGALKNALDQAYRQWVRKPMSAFAYGGTGGARAVEHLRAIAVELQMAPVRPAVHLGGGELLKVHPMGQDGPMSEADAVLTPAVAAMFDDIVWWSNALIPAREAAQAEAA